MAQPASIEMPIVVGRGAAAVKTLNDRGAIKLADLVARAGAHRRGPSPLGGGDGLVVVGGDDKGTLAAANVVAARLPRLWSMTGITLSGVDDQVARYLAKNGVDVARLGHVDRRRQRAPRVWRPSACAPRSRRRPRPRRRRRSRSWIACTAAASSRRR